MKVMDMMNNKILYELENNIHLKLDNNSELSITYENGGLRIHGYKSDKKNYSVGLEIKPISGNAIKLKVCELFGD